ncbi:MAG: putative transport system permease protein, partial [Acidimicrobiaceae bacterium]|nr:putative transport system permease protein [Acidimicrobiaceae bacterium]
MIVGIWLSGLVRRRTAGLAGSAAAVALAVALLASVGAFLQSAKITMTRRTIQSVAVDWQVEIGSGTDPRAVTAALMAGAAQAAATVAFGTTTGLSATTGSTTQTTGPGVVIGVSDDYAGLFPGEIRPLLGASRGVLVAQQTAANLHVTVGDIVTVQRAGLGPETRRIDGVVDLPQADSLFQHVGASAGSQPTAPPDNVLVVPQDDWHALMDPLTAAHPELTRFQVHTRLVHRLPNDPAAAFSRVTGLAHHLEAQLVGGVTVGDNLAAALDGARSDALYAQLLFLFLAIPGSVVAGLLASAANAAGGDRRRRSLAIMRARGATRATLGRLAVAEAAAVGVAGSAAGLAVAAAIGAVGFGSALFDAGIVAAAWGAGAVVVGMVIATLAVALPAWRDGRELTIASATRAVVPARHPRWTRLGLDGLCLAAGALLVWATSRGGYQLVLAPEGIPALSVNYAALLGPALLWLGGGLFVWRLCSAASASRALPLALRPLAGGLAHPIAATFRRQRRRLATAAILIALAVAFAASTATFNSTYRQQAAADARLTNGADVTVTEPPGSSSPGGDPSRITRTPGVSHSEPLQHRFAYVGADLQDLYGVDPATVTSGAHLQNAYVAGGHVSQTMQKLARQDDGILVSAETVNDFQLRPGDLIRLRLTSRATGQQIEVPFHLVGVVKEFPTAPRDSFLVANSRYIAD